MGLGQRDRRGRSRLALSALAAAERIDECGKLTPRFRLLAFTSDPQKRASHSQAGVCEMALKQESDIAPATGDGCELRCA